MRLQTMGMVGWCAAACALCGCEQWLGFIDDLVVASEPGHGSGGDMPGQAGSPPMLPPTGAEGAKLDLLFMIDNSISMSDKQQLLRQALPDLLARLTNPACVDPSGNEQGAPAGAECPAGQQRQFAPLADVHVGIVTSSLGDVGANVACCRAPA
jgi:hypothetical protein